MSWITVTKTVKPANVTPWMIHAGLVKATEFLDFFKLHDVEIFVENISPNESITTFKFLDENHFNTFQLEYNQWDLAIEKKQYDTENGIEITRIYEGAAVDYVPPNS